MNLQELRELMKVPRLNFHLGAGKAELQRRIVMNIKWRDKRAFKKSETASHWVPPSDSKEPSFSDRERNQQTVEQDFLPIIHPQISVSPGNKFPRNKSIGVDPMTGLNPAIRGKPGEERSLGNPVIETDPNLHTTLNSDELATLVKKLSEEIADLRRGLKDSENLRKDLERKLESVHWRNTKDLLRKVMRKKNTQIIRGKVDEQMGLLWNLENMGEVFRILDHHIDKLNHAPRSGGEPPVAILSERELEMVSYPIEGSIKKYTDEISKALCLQPDIMGHVLVPK